MPDDNPSPEPVETMDEGMPVAEEAAPASDEEKLSAFVPMDFFGGKNPKVGDIEKVEVRSIDPESGEVEFVCVYGGDKGGKSMSEQMDEAIPEV